MPAVGSGTRPYAGRQFGKLYQINSIKVRAQWTCMVRYWAGTWGSGRRSCALARESVSGGVCAPFPKQIKLTRHFIFHRVVYASTARHAFVTGGMVMVVAVLAGIER